MIDKGGTNSMKHMEAGTLVLIRYLNTFGIITEFLEFKEYKHPNPCSNTIYQNAVYLIDFKGRNNKRMEDTGEMMFEILRLKKGEMGDYLDDKKNIDQIVHDHLTEILGTLGAAVFFKPLPKP
jgi:hypothetical protein